MHVVTLYNRLTLTDSAGDFDVLRQCVAVEQSLRELGHTTARVACSLNLDAARSELQRLQPDVVFNLVESLGGTDRLMPVAVLLLESMGVPYTGAPSLSMLLTTDKLSAKRSMVEHELPTPAWLTLADVVWQGLGESAGPPSAAIIKPISEDASLGINDDSVLTRANAEQSTVRQHMASQAHFFRTPHFAEQYIDGREFNLSVLASDQGPEVLPPAEIEFIDFPADKPRIVGENAKWDERTMEYQKTSRRFNFPPSDRPLLDELEALARRCWMTFDLRGYARVDFRVDADGQPWILEVNANPCLSPDAGFAAAVQQAGLSFTDVIRRILADAVLIENTASR